ncbi:MAG: ParB/RepB/Spo0J family partition protein [Planctomycetota bacterium]
MPDAAPANTEKSEDKRPSRLGRGLSSLMGSAVPVSPPPTAIPAVSSAPVAESTGEVPRGTSSPAEPELQAKPEAHAELELVWLDLADVSPNPHQPRTHFDEDKLDELAESIRVHGIMQPVVVRPRAERPGEVSAEASAGVKYELIAGERRWRAAQRAGVPALPAIIRDLDDEASAELALVENLQREDLNPIERAEALFVLNNDFGLTHEQIGVKVGLKRSSVTNLLRLLDLGPALRAKVASGELTMGHARTLLGAESMVVQDRAAELIDRLDGITVRQAEELIRYENARAAGNSPEAPAWHPDAGSAEGVPRGTSASSENKHSGPQKSEWIQDLERQMSQALTTKVAIRPGRKNGTGQVTIHYHSLEDFDALLDKLGVQPE